MPQESCIQSDNRIKSKLGENMTVQGWTLSITDESRTPILTNVFTDTIDVEYASEWLDHNGPRYGTIEIAVNIPQEQDSRWNNYIQSMFQPQDRSRNASILIRSGNNSATYDNVMLTSVNQFTNYEDENQDVTEMTWHFSGTVNVVALLPREFRKPFNPQNLDWKIYGF